MKEKFFLHLQTHLLKMYTGFYNMKRLFNDYNVKSSQAKETVVKGLFLQKVGKLKKVIKGELILVQKEQTVEEYLSSTTINNY